MKRLFAASVALLTCLACWAEESDLAARLARVRPSLNSPDKKAREEAYNAYLNAGEEGRALLREALLALREVKLATCQAFAVPADRQKRLLTIHTKLQEARKEALRVIFDKTIYPDANHGRSGQPVVDKAVDLVKEILKTYHHPGFGWALVEVPRSRVARRALRGEALMPRYASGSPIQRFQKTAAAHDHLMEVDTRLALVGAEGLELRPSLEKLLESKALPELVKALAELAASHDYAERCLLYNAVVATSLSASERRLVDVTNEYRIQLGIRPLAINERLVQAARKHSQEMARLGYFGHSSPTAGNKSPGQRCQNEGYRHYRGENCASGGGADTAFRMWYNSSGHHRNMINPSSTEVGVGHGGPWTEDFGADPQLDLDHPPRSWKAAPSTPGGR